MRRFQLAKCRRPEALDELSVLVIDLLGQVHWGLACLWTVPASTETRLLHGTVWLGPQLWRAGVVRASAGELTLVFAMAPLGFAVSSASTSSTDTRFFSPASCSGRNPSYAAGAVCLGRVGSCDAWDVR